MHHGTGPKLPLTESHRGLQVIITFLCTMRVVGNKIKTFYQSNFLIFSPQLHAEDLEERKKREAQKSEWQPPKSESSSDEGDTDEELGQDEDLRK